MFTGLIEAAGEVIRVVRQTGDWAITIRCAWDMRDIAMGASIAVNGVCLTVVAREGEAFTVEASAETRQHTTLGQVQPGQQVNLERALLLGGRLDGHLVQGHVDGLGLVETITPRGRSKEIWFRVSGETGRYIVAKGSIAVDGVSLTVNQVRDEGPHTRFSVNIIPHTQLKTTLSSLKPGQEVNVETDWMNRAVERLLRTGGRGDPGPAAGGLDEDKLRSAGFL